MLISGVSSYAQNMQLCVYTSDSENTMKEKISPLIQYMLKKYMNDTVDIRIKLKIYNSYEKAIYALINGDCSIARFGPASYVLAKKAEPNIRLIVMESKKGKKINYGHFIVHKDSKINSLAEIKGKTVAFGNKLSTIGRYLAQSELLKQNISAKDLKSFDYLSRHDKVSNQVYTHKYEVGVVKDNSCQGTELKKIATFKAITKPWIASANMDEKSFNKIQNLFLNITDKKVLKGLKNSGFVKGTDSEYNFVRQAIENAKKFNEK